MYVVFNCCSDVPISKQPLSLTQSIILSIFHEICIDLTQTKIKHVKSQLASFWIESPMNTCAEKYCLIIVCVQHEGAAVSYIQSFVLTTGQSNIFVVIHRSLDLHL